MADVAGVITGERFTSRVALDDRAARLATALRDAGVGSGAPVAVIGRNDLVQLEVALAAARLGTSVVPMNWHWTPDEVRYVLDDARVAVLVGHADLLAPLRDVTRGVTTFWQATPHEVVDAYGIGADAAAVPSDSVDLDTVVAASPALDAAARNAASSGLFYTSGTTGQPKGVVRDSPTADQVAHRQQVLTTCYGIFEGCHTLVPTPLHHIFGQGVAIATLAAAGTVVIMARFDAERFLALVERHRITNAAVVPTMLLRLLRLPEATRARYDVRSLRHVLHTGAPCPVAVKRGILDWWGPVLWEQYGSTETGVITLAGPEEWLAHPGTVGHAFLGSEVRVLDDDGNDVPVGTPGRIYGRMHGSPDFTYLGRPEAKAAVTRHGLVSAGDIGHLDDDGFLHLSDRSSDVVISGGVNIYPAEIEAAFVAHPGVHDAVAFGVPDDDFGERVVAWVQLEDGVDLSIEDLRASLAGRLAGFKIPREIVVVDAVPRDESGKISRRRVRDAHRA